MLWGHVAVKRAMLCLNMNKSRVLFCSGEGVSTDRGRRAFFDILLETVPGTLL